MESLHVIRLKQSLSAWLPAKEKYLGVRGTPVAYLLRDLRCLIPCQSDQAAKAGTKAGARTSRITGSGCQVSSGAGGSAVVEKVLPRAVLWIPTVICLGLWRMVNLRISSTSKVVVYQPGSQGRFLNCLFTSEHVVFRRRRNYTIKTFLRRTLVRLHNLTPYTHQGGFAGVFFSVPIKFRDIIFLR
ncbi:hypothetical protein TIFTF001_037742 [Ficus carica]|uniref:Uncharacterized protein n=1 Tax=Ficus carica TaxID=3494 RepID=A0AA88E6T3_FICCA|nr:hypothetical protein TIFTF001_037739 [Ficus carica]GMN68685.1 hypothetical protein TIFTF001_037742 [Ficus carica]